MGAASIGTSPEVAASQLRAGHPVALPTETVYGLAAPLFNINAVRKVFELKGRPLNNPLIVHVKDQKQLETIAYVPKEALKLIQAFWPGPLTLILYKKANVPDIVTAGQSSIAVRSPNQPLFQKVLSLLNEPLVAPSANRFQEISPTMAEHVVHSLGDQVAYILDGGRCQFGVESTIVSLLDPQNPEVLRPGPISIETIEKVFGKEIKPITEAVVGDLEESEGPKIAPGLFKKHYSPRTPLYLVDNLYTFKPPTSYVSIYKEGAVHVFFKKPTKEADVPNVFLSENGDLQEAAFNLFAKLQDLDTQNWKSIWIEKVPNHGMGQAINDRLMRAARQSF